MHNNIPQDLLFAFVLILVPTKLLQRVTLDNFAHQLARLSLVALEAEASFRVPQYVASVGVQLEEPYRQNPFVQELGEYNALETDCSNLAIQVE